MRSVDKRDWAITTERLDPLDRIESTRFIGRRADLDALSVRVVSGARLVTILGFSGIGKTRLAARLARAVDERVTSGRRSQACKEKLDSTFPRGRASIPGMKATSRLLLAFMAICSLGADQKSCSAPATSIPTGPYLPNYWCYTDPPVGCAAYCQAIHTLAFTPACFGPASGQQFLDFRDYIIASLDAAEAQGAEICPSNDLNKFVTPCAVGFFPVELPNQDHSVCTPAPPGCPL